MRLREENGRGTAKGEGEEGNVKRGEKGEREGEERESKRLRET